MLPSLEEIFEEFADLDREDQSQYLLELGDDLPSFPLKHVQNSTKFMAVKARFG
jgi:sulfur transfer protein SufE